jgi:hypothetical protein
MEHKSAGEQVCKQVWAKQLAAEFGSGFSILRLCCWFWETHLLAGQMQLLQLGCLVSVESCIGCSCQQERVPLQSRHEYRGVDGITYLIICTEYPMAPWHGLLICLSDNTPAVVLHTVRLAVP